MMNTHVMSGHSMSCFFLDTYMPNQPVMHAMLMTLR